MTVSNRRKMMVLNPGTGLHQRAAWGRGKIKVQLRERFLRQRAARRGRAS